MINMYPVKLTMAEMQLCLINFPYREMLSTIFEDRLSDFEFIANGIFRKIVIENGKLDRKSNSKDL